MSQSSNTSLNAESENGIFVPQPADFGRGLKMGLSVHPYVCPCDDGENSIFVDDFAMFDVVNTSSKFPFYTLTQIQISNL